MFNEACPNAWQSTTKEEDCMQFRGPGPEHDQRAATVCLPCYPLEVAAVQGHSQNIQNLSGMEPEELDAQIAVSWLCLKSNEELEEMEDASLRGVPFLAWEDCPRHLCHRTTKDAAISILNQGFKPGHRDSGKMHVYFADRPLEEMEHGTAGVRADHPVEVVVSTKEVLEAGLTLFHTQSEGVLCRSEIPAYTILQVRDTRDDEILYIKAFPEAEPEPELDAQQEPAEEIEEIEVEPERPDTPRAATASTAPAPELSLPQGSAATEADKEMRAEEQVSEQYPTPRAAVPGVPAYAVVQGQALDAREDLIKCTSCPAYLIKGQMVCFSCGAQVAERVKHQNLRRKLNLRKRELKGQLLQRFGQRLPDATTSNLGGLTDVSIRGSRSFEADTLDNARKNYASATKKGYTSILDRYHKDDKFLAAMGRMGKVRRNILVMDLLAKAVILNPGRDFAQRRMARQDAAELNKTGARIVYFPSDSIALAQAGLTTQPTDPSFAVMWNGAPLSVSDFVAGVLRQPGDVMLLTFNKGWLTVPKRSADELQSWILGVFQENERMAIDENRRLEIQREKNREVSCRQLEAKAKAKAKAIPKEPSYPPPSAKGKGKGKGDDAPYRGHRDQWADWQWTDQQWADWDSWRGWRDYSSGHSSRWDYSRRW